MCVDADRYGFPSLASVAASLEFPQTQNYSAALWFFGMDDNPRDYFDTSYCFRIDNLNSLSLFGLECKRGLDFWVEEDQRLE